MQKNSVMTAGKKASMIGAGLVLVASTMGLSFFGGVASAVGGEHLIANCTQLQAMDDDAAAAGDTFKLSANIDCTGVDFEPLHWDEYFSGTFDGQGHAISGLDVDVSGIAGLFTILDGATIQNVEVSGTVHSADDYAGSIAGEGDDSSFINVMSHVDVTSDSDQAGGIAGDYDAVDEDGLIRRVASTGDVSGDGQTGGLFGYLSVDEAHTVTIEQSYASGTVTSTDNYVGGLIGMAEVYTDMDDTHLIIQDVYASGDVNAADASRIGGLIGSIDTYEFDGGSSTVVIKRAYASGAVTGDNYVSGFIGFIGDDANDGSVTLENVFTASEVTVTGGDPYAGAIIAIYYGTLNTTAVYYDETRSGDVLGSCSGDDPITCQPVNPDSSNPNYFFNNHTNAPLSAWDFDTIWVMHADTYPTFADYEYGTGGDEDGGDEDGVDSSIEDAAPNDGDANNDGTADSEQTSVASFVNTLNGDYVTLAVSDECSITDASVANANNNTVKDSAYSYPLGMMDFTIDCGDPNFEATVTQYYYGTGSGNFTVRKYTAATHAYTTIPGATYGPVTVGGQSAIRAVYTITDGGSFDEDNQPNGVIIDPAGLGVLTAGVPNTGFGRR